MTSSTRLLLFITILSGAVEAQPADTTSELTVRLYDYAEMAPGALERTRRQADAILTRAGLRINWQLCPTSEQAAKSNRECARRSGVDTIQLRILSKEMAKKMTNRGIEFGYAVALEKGFGVVAGVYYDRTVREAREIGLAPHVMLGHTMAHEIGHLLLGQHSHASSGIMSPTWRKEEVELAKKGGFVFSGQQAEAMRKQAVARLQETGDRGPSSSAILAGK